MEHEHNEDVRRVSRQDWEPPKPVRVLSGFWMGAYSFIKILLGALATVLAITAICLFAFVGLLADYLDSDAIMGSAEVAIGDFDSETEAERYFVETYLQKAELFPNILSYNISFATAPNYSPIKGNHIYSL